MLKCPHEHPEDGILVLWDMLEPCRYLGARSEGFPYFYLFYFMRSVVSV